MFFASCRKTLLAMWAFSVVLTGCGTTDKRPATYHNIFEVNAQLPAHASGASTHQSLQRALIKRNLVVAENGEILPVNASVCGSSLYYRVTSPSLPVYLNRHNDLFAGYYVDVQNIGQQWQIVKTDNTFSQSQPTGMSLSLFAMSLSGKLAATDTILVRPHPHSSPTALAELTSSLTNLLPGVTISWLMPDSPVTVEKTLATSNARIRVLMKEPHLQVGIVVDLQPLKACLEQSDFISPVSPLPTQASYTLEQAVNALPADADFTELSRQQTLLAGGQYLSNNGQILDYRAYFNNVHRDPCALSAAERPEVCRKRINDGEQRQIKNKVIMTLPVSPPGTH